MKKLSIIITAYNVQGYIEDCLNSLLPQITPDCEFIVVEDCSTDETLFKLMNLHIHSIIANSENCGVSFARNIGLHNTTGDYVAFLDGDDLVEPDYVATILAAINSEKDYYLLSWFNFGRETYLANKLPDWNCSVWSRIFKRSIIKHEFFADLSWGEDLLFLKENITVGMTFGYIMKPIYKYRENRPGSLTQQNT